MNFNIREALDKRINVDFFGKEVSFRLRDPLIVGAALLTAGALACCSGAPLAAPTAEATKPPLSAPTLTATPLVSPEPTATRRVQVATVGATGGEKPTATPAPTATVAEVKPTVAPTVTPEVKPTVTPTVELKQYDMLTDQDAKNIKVVIENNEKYFIVRGKKIKAIPLNITDDYFHTSTMQSGTKDQNWSSRGVHSREWRGFLVEPFQVNENGLFSYALAIENQTGGVTVIRFLGMDKAGVFQSETDTLVDARWGGKTVDARQLVGKMVLGQQVRVLSPDGYNTTDDKIPKFQLSVNCDSKCQARHKQEVLLGKNAPKAVEIVNNGVPGLIELPGAQFQFQNLVK